MNQFSPPAPRIRPSIVDVVFATQRRRRRRWVPFAVISAVALHGFLFLWSTRSERSLESWSAELATRVHVELGREDFVEIVKPPTPPAPPPVLPKPSAPEKSTLPKEHTDHASRPPPPAQAGAIIAQQPNPNVPVDLTGETFVTGTAAAYAGGVTAANGTNTVAVKTLNVDPNARPGHSTGPDESSPVRLEEEDWRCPWPREADAEQIDEQVAVVKVVVRSDGTVESAMIVADPGHGFGQAALICAKQTKFTPAHDRQGRPIFSKSPPIRVRFTR